MEKAMQFISKVQIQSTCNAKVSTSLETRVEVVSQVIKSIKVLKTPKVSEWNIFIKNYYMASCRE